MSYTTLRERTRKTLMRKIPQGIKKVNPALEKKSSHCLHSSSLDAIVNVLILFFLQRPRIQLFCLLCASGLSGCVVLLYPLGPYEQLYNMIGLAQTHIPAKIHANFSIENSDSHNRIFM